MVQKFRVKPSKKKSCKIDKSLVPGIPTHLRSSEVWRVWVWDLQKCTRQFTNGVIAKRLSPSGQIVSSKESERSNFPAGTSWNSELKSSVRSENHQESSALKSCPVSQASQSLHVCSWERILLVRALGDNLKCSILSLEIFGLMVSGMEGTRGVDDFLR